MKKLTLILVAGLLLFGASAAFADEIELGIAVTPIPAPEYAFPEDIMPVYPSFHFGYGWFGILYASWDAQVLPPFTVQDLTSYVDKDTQEYVQGFYRPGFMNFFDIGVRLPIGPVVVFAETGLNSLYVHRQDDPEIDPNDEIPGNRSFGTNLRLGAGWKFDDAWGITLVGTSVYPNFQAIGDVFEGLTSDSNPERKRAMKELTDGLFPSLLFTLYVQ